MRRSVIWAFGVVLTVASACSPPPQPPPAAVRIAPAVVMPTRAHPHGLETDEITTWPSGALATLWPVGGRHPVWRGCQHVYDPALSSYLYEGVVPKS